MKISLIFIITLLSYKSYAQKNSYIEIKELIKEYSYKDEILSMRSGVSYPVLSRLTEFIYNDSVYINFTQQQIKEFSILFLKKRAISMAQFGVNKTYITNMRYWPGELVAFCINTVLDLNPKQTTSVKELVRKSSDFECVKILLDFKTVDSFIDKKFYSLIKNYECVEHSFDHN